jgi:hypothetical protein
MFGKRSLASLALIGFISAGGLGCDMFGGNDKDNNDKSDHKVSTKSDHSNINLPSRADRVTSGSGEAFSWRADRSGTVYVYDTDMSKVVYSRHINADQRLNVDVPNNQILLDNNVVNSQDLKNKHHYDIYFDRDRS